MKATKTSVIIRVLSGLSLFALLLAAIAAGASPAAAQQSYVLQGRVLSYNAGALAGAKINLYALPQHNVVTTATTDADGNFTIDTGPGNFALDASANGYETDEQTVFVTSYDSGILFLLREASPEKTANLVATITGKVLSADDVPLGGMNITVYDRQQGDSSQPRPIVNATVSNADGSYSLRVPAGTVWPSLATQAVWGYDYTPINVKAGDTINDIIFVAQIRVLPRVLFPSPTAVELPPTATPTATPVTVVGPEVGMPNTGGPSNDLPIVPFLLAAMLLAGVVLRVLAGRKATGRIG